MNSDFIRTVDFEIWIVAVRVVLVRDGWVDDMVFAGEIVGKGQRICRCFCVGGRCF